MAETYKSFGTNLGSTAATTIYSGVTGTGIVNSINCSNIDLYRSTTVTIEMVKGSTGYSIITAAALPVSTSFQALDAPLVLESGNTLRATAGTTGDVDVIVSVLEITA
jgi:hypothetical protein